jgi:hypothetical protein
LPSFHAIEPWCDRKEIPCRLTASPAAEARNRHHGEGAIGAVQTVGGITKLGSDAAAAVLTPAFLDLVPGFFATEVEASVRSLERLLRMCSAREIPVADLYQMLGYNVSVPPYVRQAMLSRSFDNDDLLPKLRKPCSHSHSGELASDWAWLVAGRLGQRGVRARSAGEDAVVSDEVDIGSGDESGEPAEELGGR